jgi:hypothetical protein
VCEGGGRLAGVTWHGEAGSGADTTQACGRQVAVGAALPFEPETGEERGGGPVRETAMWAGP